jgi:hypothetical protein
MAATLKPSLGKTHPCEKPLRGKKSTTNSIKQIFHEYITLHPKSITIQVSKSLIKITDPLHK